ncbi:hypothetical protein H2248_012364 [Termitomyces sp. 'cryptogamus']|nr:hypothetical protein H2248_012364 [Termitomyces sp. 'cryptogamus']
MCSLKLASPKFFASIWNVIKDIEKDDAEEYSPGVEKKLIRSIDLHILPLFGLLYAVSVLDRVNLGAARVAGMGVDLELTVGDRYSIASCLYFVPYVLFQIPSSIIVQKLGPRIWLSICVTGWGAAQLGMGFVPKWGYLVLCRLFLGLFESGLLPAQVFVVSTWYKRHEVQKRVAGFYLFSILIGGFGPIIAYALTLIAPRGGLNGWQWIFVIEGAITIVVGGIAYIFFPNFPNKNRFLSEELTKIVLDRVEKDRGDAMPDEMTFTKVCTHLSDWKIWTMGIMLMCATIPTYVAGYFTPIILTSMGYTARDAMLLSAPPGVLAAFFTFVFAWISDKLRQRALLIAFQTILVIIGLTLTSYTINNGSRYFGLCLITVGSCASVPGILSYNANNVVSHTKRSISTAVIVAFAGIAGIFSTTVFRQKDYPKYLNGIWATMGCQFLLLILLGMTSYIFIRKNRLAREGKIGPLEGRQGFYYTT